MERYPYKFPNTNATYTDSPETPESHQYEEHQPQHDPNIITDALSRSVFTAQVSTKPSFTPTPINQPTPRMDVEIRGRNGQSFRVNALPDSGATRTILSSNIAYKFGLQPDPSRKELITVANGSTVSCDGAVDIAILFPRTRSLRGRIGH